MMTLGNSAEVNREQLKDRLRQAERDRLAAQVKPAAKKPALWRSIRERISEAIDSSPTAGKEVSDEVLALGER